MYIFAQAFNNALLRLISVRAVISTCITVSYIKVLIPKKAYDTENSSMLLLALQSLDQNYVNIVIIM